MNKTVLKVFFFLSMLPLLTACNSNASKVSTAENTSTTPVIKQLSGQYDNGVQWTYNGEVLNGEANGSGVLVRTDGIRYDGEWRGFIFLRGTIASTSRVEKGEFYNGKTTLIHTISGLKMVRTYKNGKLINEQSPLMAHITSANYDAAYKLRGKKPILAMKFHLDKKTNMIKVNSAELHGPAFFAGIRANDVIVRYGGNTIDSDKHLLNLIQKSEYGKGVTLELLRNNQPMNVTVYPSIRPDNYRAGKGMTRKNSYDELIQFYLKDLSTFDEQMADLELPPKYREKAQKDKQTYLLTQYRAQACKLKEKAWYYQGSACKNGLAHGEGVAVNYLKGLKYEGAFRQGLRTKGLLSIKGIEMYDGPLKNGKPDGKGICFYKGEPETCEYYRGKRVDVLYKQRILNAKQQEKIDAQLAEMRKMQETQNARLDHLQRNISAHASPRASNSNSLESQMADYAMSKASEKVVDALFDKLF